MLPPENKADFLDARIPVCDAYRNYFYEFYQAGG